MDDNTEAIVRMCWARLLGLTDTALTRPGLLPHPVPGSDRLRVLTLFDTTVVLGDPAALDRLSSAAAAHSTALTALLTALGPDVRLRADVRLHHGADYPPAPVLPSPSSTDEPEALIDTDPATAAQVWSTLPPDDRAPEAADEGAPETVLTLLDADHRPVATGGYRIRAGMLADLTVVTAPDHRRAGHGLTLTRALTEHALDAGLIPQLQHTAGATGAAALAARVPMVATGALLEFTVPDAVTGP